MVTPSGNNSSNNALVFFPPEREHVGPVQTTTVPSNVVVSVSVVVDDEDDVDSAKCWDDVAIEDVGNGRDTINPLDESRNTNKSNKDADNTAFFLILIMMIEK